MEGFGGMFPGWVWKEAVRGIDLALISCMLPAIENTQSRSTQCVDAVLVGLQCWHLQHVQPTGKYSKTDSGFELRLYAHKLPCTRDNVLSKHIGVDVDKGRDMVSIYIYI